MIAVALMQAGVPAIEDMPGKGRIGQTNLPQLFIVLGAVVVVALLAFIWVAFIRKKPRHRHQHHWKVRGKDSENGGNGEAQPTRGRRRRSRSVSRPRNPTLAETRGLPPLRDDDSSPYN